MAVGAATSSCDDDRVTLHRIAHRGYSAVAPENTLPAFEIAVRAGATFVEFDVRTTADGVPVVIHDRTLDRTTSGTGRVADALYADIAALDAGSWFSPVFAGARVPSLAATLELLAPSSAGVLLEVKAPASGDEVKAIVETVAAHGFLERTIIQSFDPEIVALARSHAPDLRRGLLREGLTGGSVALARSLEAVCCNPSVEDVLGNPETVAELIAGGFEIMPWTANDTAEWAALAGAGVAGVITDHVAELNGFLATRS